MGTPPYSKYGPVMCTVHSPGTYLLYGGVYGGCVQYTAQGHTYYMVGCMEDVYSTQYRAILTIWWGVWRMCTVLSTESYLLYGGEYGGCVQYTVQGHTYYMVGSMEDVYSTQDRAILTIWWGVWRMGTVHRTGPCLLYGKYDPVLCT